MRLHELKAPKGAKHRKRRIGRGESSGWGKTSGRGMNGQGQRSGTGKPGPGFEGGQVPMYRRMPKRGFVNIFAKRWAEVNVDILAEHFSAGAEVNLALLKEKGLASNRADGVRVLGRGDLGHVLKVEAAHFTASARSKIEAAGGTATDAQAAPKAAGKDSPDIGTQA